MKREALLDPKPVERNGHPSVNGLQEPTTGRFAIGNRGGPGNPRAGQVEKYRAAIFAAVSEDDVARVIRALVKAAIGGDVAAAKVVLDRCLGKVPQAIVATVYDGDDSPAGPADLADPRFAWAKVYM
jgi:hypothetical protein